VGSLMTGTVFWEFVNPITALHRELIYGSLVGSGFTLTLLAGIFLFDVFISRHGFCGHLCPVGASYALIGRYRLPAIAAPNCSACDDCMACYVTCPEPQVITPALKGASKGASPLIKDIDCTLCGRCIDVCPHNVFTLSSRIGVNQNPVDKAVFNEAA